MIDHSSYTSGVDVMSKLNARDGTPGQAASPYVFASVLGASAEEEEAKEGGVDESLFKWFGQRRPVPNSTMLDTPQRTTLRRGEGAVEQLSFVGGREAARERDVSSLGGVPGELLAEPPRQSVVHRRVERGEGEAEAARVGVGVLVLRSVGEGADELSLLGGEGRVRDAQGGDARGGVVLAGEEAEEEEVEGGADRRARDEGVRDVDGIKVVAAPPERLEPAAVAAAQVHLRREGLPPPIGLAEPPLADALQLRPRRRRHQHVEAAALPLQ